MERIELRDGWKVIDADAGAGDAPAMSRVGYDVSGWLDATAPGDVNDILIRAGRMPDPHVGDNGRSCYWVTSRDWWWRLEFAGPAGEGRVTDLVLDGLGGHVDVFLNGRRLGRTRNAFRKFRFDVSGVLAPEGRANVLLLRFASIDGLLGGPREDELTGWGARMTLLRKPQFAFGWGWALPLPTIGVLNSVALERHDGWRLYDVAARAHLSGRVDFHLQPAPPVPEGRWEVRVRIAGHGADVAGSASHEGGRTYLSLRVPDVRWWWPAGSGEQPLYDYGAELLAGGKVADVRRGRLGFREVRIVEEPFTPGAGRGMSFWLEVNGEKVFCKGGNWVPLELWPATATDEQYRFYLAKAAEANFNMLRIWGGGIYERETFYDLCDELGLMVWQDFMFASHGYPLDVLREEIIAEADYQLRRLRSRPSVAIWCGINEDVHSWQCHLAGGYAPAGDGERAKAAGEGYADGSAAGAIAGVDRLRDDPQIYTMILRGLVGKLGHGVPYVESSPMSYDDCGNLPNSGNCHVSCWKYALFETGGRHERFRGHFERVCSFDSEFCIHGPACRRTMEAMLPAEHRWPPDEVWVYRLQRGHANLPHFRQTLMVAGATFGEIDSLAKFVKHGQATHAEHMRAEFESARRDRPNNGGTMMWAHNEPWPTSNWSIIDYCRRPKPAYYAARRACAPLLPIIFERGGQVEMFFSNDTRQPREAQLTFGRQRLDGETLWQKQARVTCSGCATVRFHRMPREEAAGEPGTYLFIDAVAGGEALPRVTYFPDMWKDVPWPRPNVKVELLAGRRIEGGWTTAVAVTTDAYARLCHLVIDDRAAAWFDDNFFDLCAGGRHVVNVRSDAPPAAQDIRAGHWWTDWRC